MHNIGLIAGTGDLPLHVADEAATRGFHVVAIAFRGFTNPALERIAKETFWLKLGQLEKAISIFKTHGVERIVMAGKIEKSNLLRPWNLRLDRRALRLIRSMADWRDDTVLAAIADEFRKDGIVIEEITPWAGRLMAPLGVLTKRSPNETQWKDIAFGRTMAQGIGALDIGQTVVVKSAAVIVAEAIEGTDKAILRAGDLGIPNGVVVKMAKPQQDMRFDVPGIGPSTVDSMITARAIVLAVEAGKTMITDFSETVRRADKAKMVIVGIPVDGPVAG
ncbi:MAG: UDP-2,3-diacylglucosamine diphosphatase LpxI [Desulfomonile tiedjei]|uniref:UDP-2,3-diacylglucosamine diphosphatase LpxI n=1 Tax=Desulfomonile tiedjei TaxID=2358 RepID=A0A9D6Z571_9BACT|nr:UDP-2,3-diacylglucosamine diphosphatase LpxI [Desulfomonile tiedjei]